jgi:hypothetical protein
VRDWLQIALRPAIITRALKVAVIVGTALTIINQGNLLLAGILTPDPAIKILLTYCVPYCVSTYAGVAAVRDRLRESAQ